VDLKKHPKTPKLCPQYNPLLQVQVQCRSGVYPSLFYIDWLVAVSEHSADTDTTIITKH